VNDNIFTMIGTLVDDPSLKFTPSGAAVCSFRLASTPRKFDRDANQWVDQKDATLFLSCSIWRQAAENMAEAMKRGDRVVAVGKLRQRSFETREGEKRTVFELECDEVAASLKFATVTVNKMARSGSGNNGSSAPRGNPQSGGGFADDPWATPAGGQSSFADEAPF